MNSTYSTIFRFGFVRFGFAIAFVAFVSLVAGGVFGAVAQDSFSRERNEIAVAHYARARSLLAEAMSEFDKGRAIARPDLLVDSDEWRLSIVSRMGDLERVIDPLPRVTRSGVSIGADSIQIRTPSKKQPKKQPQKQPSVIEKAEDSRYGISGKMPPKKPAAKFSQRKEARIADDKLFDASEDIDSEKESVTKDAQKSGGTEKSVEGSELIETGKTNAGAADSSGGADKAQADRPASGQPIGSGADSGVDKGVVDDIRKDDPSVAAAIEKVIGEKIKKMKEDKIKEEQAPTQADKSGDGGLFAEYDKP